MSRYAKAHKVANLNGPGNARPTALQIIQDKDPTGRLSDKFILITGVSSSIGIDTLRALHTTGAHVYGTIHDMSKGQKSSLKSLPTTTQAATLDNLSSACQRAPELLSKSPNNLNIPTMACPHTLTSDGYKSQFDHKPPLPFPLIIALLPRLLSIRGVYWKTLDWISI
jgi:hypothetical protein